ncbi:hypothetical protein NFJ86_06060 [Escherichia fergusonii]|nr:hypothetical protein [Escherichia fergusonii]WFW88233.1 hypothetical protein NFJ86_06060 [Escherichia fergusonii]
MVTGQPEGCPTSATIDTVCFTGMRWLDTKKDARGVSVAIGYIFQVLTPGCGFCHNGNTVNPVQVDRQAVFIFSGVRF